MKKFKFLLLMAFWVALAPFTHSCAQDDGELEKTLDELKKHIQEKQPFFKNEGFPNPPTEEDFAQLEAVLLNPGYTLPLSLKKFHFTLGNFIIGGVSFPTAHNIGDKGQFRSYLLDFIRDGHERGIPYNTKDTWIPFGDENGQYVCINLETEKICYFSFVPQFKKYKKEYNSLSVWIKEVLLYQ